MYFDKKLIKFLLISLLIHLMIGVLLVHPNDTERKHESEKKSKRSSLEMKIHRRGNGIIPCVNHYNGIGITYNPGTGNILDAPEGLPAHRSGIRVGDKLIDDLPDRDTKKDMKIRIKRDGKILSFVIPKESICFDES